jgi:predicted DNA-binding protein
MATDRMTVRIDPRLRRRLRAMSRRQKRKESELVREALEAYCQNGQKELSCYDLALRAGFIGSVKNLPPDLSTNPKYMEGFGES